MRARTVTALGAILAGLLWPAVGAAQCSWIDNLNCAAMGGVPDARGGECWCDVYEYVPRRVANARDGDVGIVPIDGNGSEVVATVTREIGQYHRHAVMFWDDGRRTRHDTMYIGDAEDGSEADAGGDYVTLLQPLFGRVRFDGDELQNGLPGAISQTIDDTLARGRLSTTGLVLKPAQRLVPSTSPWSPMRIEEPNRPAFEAAVAAARTRSAYYKLGDYTDMDSMSRPWSSTRSGDLRGSHCSGYVTDHFRDEGLPIDDVFYPESLREDVAEVLYEEVRDMCRNETGFWSDLGAAVTLHWSVCRNIGNQVVNCFADLSCWDTSNTWRSSIGTGSAVSPDNLLPESFRYTGTTDYDWDGITLTQGSGSFYPILGATVSHPGLSGTEPGTSATSQSPFQRVAAMSMTGGYYTFSHSVRL